MSIGSRPRRPRSRLVLEDELDDARTASAFRKDLQGQGHCALAMSSDNFPVLSFARNTHADAEMKPPLESLPEQPVLKVGQDTPVRTPTTEPGDFAASRELGPLQAIQGQTLCTNWHTVFHACFKSLWALQAPHNLDRLSC